MTKLIDRPRREERISPAESGAFLALEILAEGSCPECDNRGLECRSFQVGPTCCVLAVCLRCGHAEVF